MGNVTFSIAGRAFTLACADGEEEHIARLGALVDEKANAAGAAGQTESRMFLFASLMLADELHELRARAAAALATPPEQAPTPAPATPQVPADLAERIARIADRVENLALLVADGLETGPANA